MAADPSCTGISFERRACVLTVRLCLSAGLPPVCAATPPSENNTRTRAYSATATYTIDGSMDSTLYASSA